MQPHTPLARYVRDSPSVDYRMLYCFPSSRPFFNLFVLHGAIAVGFEQCISCRSFYSYCGSGGQRPDSEICSRMKSQSRGL